MKRILFFTTLFLSIFAFGYGQTEKTENNATKPSKSDRFPSVPFLKDSLKLQEQLNQYIDSLNLDGKSLYPKGDVRKFRFNNPTDSSKVKRYFVPPSNKYPNPNFNNLGEQKKKPYVTQNNPHNMPIYVPEDIYMPIKKADDKGNMPIKVPEGYDKKDQSIPKK